MFRFPSIYLFCLAFFLVFSYGRTQVTPALEIIKDLPKVRDFTLSRDGNEAYISIQSPLEEISVIGCLRKQKGVWTKPEIVSFTGGFCDLEPMLSPDGLRLYFVSDRPLIESDTLKKDFDIWYVERADGISEWSKPINLGKEINSDADEFFPSLAQNDNLYFTRESKSTGTKDDIWFAEWKGKFYAKPINLGDSINSPGYEFNAFISPDESLLIYTAYGRKEGLGSGDLYISYNKNGKWTKAENLGDQINSVQMDYCPFYDDQTKTLYFTSKLSRLMDVEVKSYEDVLKMVNSYENGLSRVYKVQVEFSR